MDVPSVVDPKAERRGPYRVSARLARVLTLLASGEAKTQIEACSAVGMTPRALQLALKKPNVREFMRDQIMTSLGVSAMRAARRMDELLHSTNEMVSFQASRYALGVGAGVVQPSPPSATVNVGIALADRAGYVLDLREPGDVDESRVIRSFAGPLIEGEARELPEAPAVDAESVDRK